MTTMFSNPYNYQFIGRQGAIDAFHSLRSLRAQHNVLYLEADGGLGKTRVLRQYVEECKKQRRPWHVTPTGSEFDPLIDFYDFNNRTVAGLRRSIATRLGLNYFATFQEKDMLLHEQENALKKNSEDRSLRAQIASLRFEVEHVFFEDMARALREIRNYSLLLFDTFEMVYNRRVGRWFLEEFLPNPSTHGCLIVFAGRPRHFQRPANVHYYQLPPFTDDEANDYFAQKWEIIPSDSEYALIELCMGYPLLLDLGVYYMRRLEGNIVDLVDNWPNLNQAKRQQYRQKFKESVVSRFVTSTELEHQVIQDMAHLKRRYNQAMYERRQVEDVYTEPVAYKELRARLHHLPFIKYRRDDDSLALHDIFQEMIEEFGGGDWRGLAKSLYQDIVLDWYDETIEHAEDELKRDILKGEQLAYILQRDENKGLAYYNQYFVDIQKFLTFDLHDLLWGELADYLGVYRDSIDEKLDNRIVESPNKLVSDYYLTYKQVDWLFNQGHYQEALPILECLLHSRFQNIQETTMENDIHQDIVISLGHCYIRTGALEQAKQILENWLRIAEKDKDNGALAAYAYNLGHVYRRQGKWTESLRLYESAVEHAQGAKYYTILAESLFVMARLRAQQGDYRQAFQELRRSLNLTDRVARGKVRQAQAFIYAGDVYRYASDFESAKLYYRRALDLFKQLNEAPDWLAQALAGLGASYQQAGARQRLENLVSDQEALAIQLEAFGYLNQALVIARENKANTVLMTILDRLADIYIECSILEKKLTNTSDLGKSLHRLNLVEEVLWKRQLRQSETPFVELDILGKAQRLFEVACLQAEKLQNYHLVLDYLIGATRIAQRRGHKADIDYFVGLIGALKGLDDPTQEIIFFHLLTIFQGHLAFDEDRESALIRYQTVLPKLADLGGFGWHQAQNELPEIANRIKALDQREAKQICQQLRDSWYRYPELLVILQDVLDHFVEMSL